MIIATALGNLFNGISIAYNATDITVNYHYGDQQELLAWINAKTKAKVRKYPLVWYILNDFTEYQGWYSTDATLVILQNTQSDWFNPKRQEESYTKIIEPVWIEVKNALKSNNNVDILGDLQTQFNLLDRPNYGIEGKAQDLSQQKSNKSILADVIDARVIKFKLRIKAKCLI